MAAGIFGHLKDIVLSHVQQEPTPDLSPDTLNALSALMVAQAQEAIYRKAAAGIGVRQCHTWLILVCVLYNTGLISHTSNMNCNFHFRIFHCKNTTWQKKLWFIYKLLFGYFLWEMLLKGSHGSKIIYNSCPVQKLVCLYSIVRIFVELNSLFSLVIRV